MGDPIFTPYSLVLACAFQVGLVDATLRLQSRKASPRVLGGLQLCAAVGGIVGAKALWLAEEGVWSSGNIVVAGLRSGYSSLGGIAAATAMCAIYLCRNTSAPLDHVDALTPAVAIGVAVSKIGCFLNGCCFGRPDLSMFSIEYGVGTPAFAMLGFQPVFPLQLVVCLAAIAAYLLTAGLYGKRFLQGSLFGLFLVSFGTLRFLAYQMWGIRPDRPFLMTPQGISMIAVVSGSVWMAAAKVLKTGQGDTRVTA